MPVIQISKVIHCLGTSGELPDRLELGQLGFTTDTADVLMGAAGLAVIAGRKSYPYENIKILTELDVQKTMTGEVYHHGPLYNQQLISSLGVMDVPLFKYSQSEVDVQGIRAKYGNYDYSFTSSDTSQMGEIMVAVNALQPHVSATAHVWGLITDTTFQFTTLMVGDQVLLRISWTPSDLLNEIYKFHMAGREWIAPVSISAGTPPTPKPIPTRVLDLSAAAQSPTTVLLTYTNSVGAISHEYRLNGGVIAPVPGGKLVTGLSSNTTYSFEVRGINANGNGPWSNVANATTTGVVQSYPDNYSMTQGKSLTVVAPGVLANDTNAFGLSQTAEVVTQPGHGTLTLNANGSFTYIPTTTFTGTDTFTYRAWDGIRYGAPATVSIVVNANPAPVANPNSYTLNQGATLSITAPGVLANDTDANGDPLTAQLVTNVLHGVLALNNDGSFTYTPTSGYTGGDSFTYKAFDGVSFSNIVTVSLTVNSVQVPNQPPVAVNHSYTASQDTPFTLAAPGLLAGCSDPEGATLTISSTAGAVTNPVHGTISTNANGSFTYTPNPGYFGSDSFTYKVSDGLANSNAATVNLTVTQTAAPNVAPVANNNSYTVTGDQVLTIAAPGVLGNDTDANGDPLTASIVTLPSHGTLTFNANGSFVYTPTLYFSGSDSFTYRAYDGSLYSNNATVNITVTPVNHPDTFVGITSRTVSNVAPLATNNGAYWVMKLDGTVYTGPGSATTLVENWLTNTIDGVVHNPGAYEFNITPSNVVGTQTTYQQTGTPNGWYNVATAPDVHIKLSTAAAEYASIVWNVQLRPVGGSVLSNANITMVVDTTSSTAPSGGGGGCVWTQAYLADNSLVGNATVGHPLLVLDDDGCNYHADTIHSQTFEPQRCAILETESGITLTCSYSTPIAVLMEDGSVNTVRLVDSIGRKVPVLDNGDFRYETLVNYTDVGSKMVSLINVNNGIYAAGDHSDRFIFTHNVLSSQVLK